MRLHATASLMLALCLLAMTCRAKLIKRSAALCINTEFSWGSSSHIVLMAGGESITLPPYTVSLAIDETAA